MKEEIFKLITNNSPLDATELITQEIKNFLNWKDDLNCPFSVHYNGTDANKPKVSYDKGNKNYTINEVYEYFKNQRQ
jgi:hypothetical protein